MITLNLDNRRSLEEIINEYSEKEPLSVSDKNTLIYGDNLEGMCRLLPQFREKIDLVYIDPPYNTGKIGRAHV